MSDRKNQVTQRKPTADGITVHCAHSEIVPTDSLVLHPRNPNEHPTEQVRVYLKIIQEHGWRRAPVISKRSGFVTKGNGAILAARAGELKQVPVDYQDYESEAAEIEDLLADNELARLAACNDSQMNQLLKELEEQGRDLELAGILKPLEQTVELKPIPILPPPKMAWVLIGIPLVSYAKINQKIEEIARDPDALVETTFTDGREQENGQP